MIFHSKFDLGQPVWHITNIGMDIFQECPSCSAGKVPLPDGRSLDCPRCKASGTVAIKYRHRWQVQEKMVIGQVRLLAGGLDDKDKEEYMTYERGIGSGSVFDRDDLFATPELAQVECDKRNREPGREWACVDCNPELRDVQYSGWNEWRWCYVHKARSNHLDVEKGKKLIEERAAQVARAKEG